ncbi:MAG: fatty acyl-AMP ligase [Pseudomonadota bacterium]|nr:fatty acyl-AMP ligase [Pseudomonadota bacterium]
MSTVADLLHVRAERAPDARAFRFLGARDGDADDVSAAALHARASALAARLDVAPGDRVLILHPPGNGYIAAFFGCLLAGAVPVPAYPPRMNRNLERIQAIMADAGASVAVSTAAMAARLSPEPELAGLRWVAEDAPDTAGPFTPVRVAPETVAFLQYTSGSTGTPKGVMVTHANLLANLAAIIERFRLGPHSRGVIWLPPFHDMGLIGGILAPMAALFPCTLMAPTTFLVRPSAWLTAVSREQATVSGGPDFAWALATRRVSEAVRATLDLSAWDVAFTGAEPVRPATLAKFVETFAPCGFRPGSFLPCYGLAEGTLIVSGVADRKGATMARVSAEALARMQVEPGDTEIVSCGPAALDTELRITHPETGAVLGEGHVGEIQVRGPGVAAGYWGRPEATAEAFPDGWLRTGDLGFLARHELFVTGRQKDLVLLRGRNLYPQDLEVAAEAAHTDLRGNSSAAFGVEVDGEERLVLVLEVDARRVPEPTAITDAVIVAIAQAFDASVHAVVLLPAGGIPRTSSGKVRRAATRLAWLAGTLTASDEDGAS